MYYYYCGAFFNTLVCSLNTLLTANARKFQAPPRAQLRVRFRPLERPCLILESLEPESPKHAFDGRPSVSPIC